MPNPWKHIDRDINEGTSHITLIAVLSIVALIFIAGLIIIASWLDFGVGWAVEPAQRQGVTNVKAEHEKFYTQRRGLESAVANIKVQETKINELKVVHGEDTSKWSAQARQDYKLSTEALQAMQFSYNSQCAEYQAAWDNFFHSSVAPDDLPRTCGYTQ